MEAFSIQCVEQRVTEVAELRRCHAEWGLPVRPGLDLLRGDIQKVAIAGLYPVAGIVCWQRMCCVLSSRTVPGGAIVAARLDIVVVVSVMG